VPGRSALLYEIRPEAGFVLALDIGHKYLRGAIADLAGIDRARTSRQVTATSLGDRVAEVVTLADDLCAIAGISRDAVTQTVVGCPGIYDPQRNVMALTGGLPDWDRPEALAGLREAFGPALGIENDVDAAALAERAHGHGRDVDDFAFVHVGTGVGMGVMLGGKLHRGVHGVAGEIAFMPIGGGREDDPEQVRRRGGLETNAGADGVVRAARESGMPGLSAQEIFEAAEEGDERAAHVVAREARLVASAICCVITVVDPSLIVLGGGIGRAPGFAATVTEELRAMAPVLPEVRVSALGTDVVVDGCLAEGTSLAWGRLVSAKT
jgi:predicted NBD/HSP70 family sugar kinase